MMCQNRNVEVNVPLCFEVTINDEPSIVAGRRDLKVLSAIVTLVAAGADLDVHVGGMVDRSDHVAWLDRELRRGDVVTIRIVESEHPAEPATRSPTDPSFEG